MSVLTIQFLIHARRLEFINTRVLVPRRHLALTSPLVGESDSPGSVCPDPEAWNLWILPGADQSGAVEVWIIGRPSRALSFQALDKLSSFPIVTREHLLYCS